MTIEEYGVGELIYDAKIYDEMNNFDDDLEFYYNLAKEYNGKILELCCGTGRLTIPLKEKGIDICGVDFTKNMLEEAKHKASVKKLKIDFILGDMKDLSLPDYKREKFDMIFIPFNSLQNTYTIDDVSNVFSSVRKYLKNNGIFVFDIFNPSIHFLVEGEKKSKEIKRFTLEDGRNVIITEKLKYDSATQTNRVIWKHEIDGKTYNQKLDMRCFYPLEMDLIIKFNKFKTIEKFGNYKKEKFDSNSIKQIYICKKELNEDK